MPLDGSNVIWRPQPGPQEALIACPIQDILFGGARGGGKRLCVNTPVPVPLTTHTSGWKTMGTIVPGDEVFSPRGVPVRVDAVSPILIAPDTFEVAFNTGEVILADGDHLWLTITAAERKAAAKLTPAYRAARRAKRPSRDVESSRKPGVSAALQTLNRARVYEYKDAPTGGIRTTADIAASMMDGGEVNHSVAVTAPVELPGADLPLASYLFGAWLGDGRSISGHIGMAADDLLALAPHLPKPAAAYYEPRPGGKPFLTWRFEGMTTKLRQLGVLGCKRIPPAYLRASIAQRVALLQGMLDTDGHCDKRGQIEIGFSNRGLMDDTLDLLSGLGIKAAITEREARCNGIPAGLTWRIKFVAPFLAFRLERKAARQKVTSFRPTTQRRFIVAVRRSAPVLMRCIKVDHDDGLFLVGRTMIATHNTGGAIGKWLDHAGRYGAAAIGVFFRRQFRDLGGLQTQMTRFFRPLGAIWRQRDSMWLFPNGATLLLRHLWDERDADSYQGHEYTFLCFEEVGQWPSPKAIDMLRATLRSTTGVKPVLLLTGNPGGAGHQWLKNRYIIHAPNGYRPIVAPDTGEYRVFIPSRLSDNTILLNADPNYARRLQQVGGPALVKAWLNGDWDIVAGGFFDDIWNPERHVLPQFVVPPEWRYRRAFDWGSSRPAALGIWAVADGVTAPASMPDFCPPKNSLILAGELYTVSKDGTGDVVPNVGLEWTNDKLGAEMAKTTASVTDGRGCQVSVADPSIWKREGGPSIHDQMAIGAKREGDAWSFVKADNSRVSGWQIVRTMLRQSSAAHAEGPGMWVMDNNPEWLRTVPVLQRDRTRVDDVDTECEDHHGDQTRYAAKASNLATQYVGVAPVIVR